MKCNYTCRQMNKLVKDPESGRYVLRHPEKGSKNCVERARAAWLAKAASMTSQQKADLQRRPELLMYDQAAFPAILEFKVVEAGHPYGYEFLPNSSRLVITPLTERCFQSLFIALHH